MGGLGRVPVAIGGASPLGVLRPTPRWEHCPRGHRLMPGRMLVGSIACSCGQAHHLAMRPRRRHQRGTAGQRMQLARRASARPPANLPGSQRAPTPVDSHLVDGRTSTDRDVLACHWLDLAGIASLRPPAKLRNVDHPPAAVAGDIDIEAGHWSLPDEAVEVFTQEHEIGQAPVQRPSGHANRGRRQPVARKQGGRPTVARKL